MSIEFYSAFKGSRPVRLSEETRVFADEALHGRYGREAQETPYLAADDIEGFVTLSPYKKHDAMITLVAAEAPLRICDNELLCGSATLGGAIGHVIPVCYGGSVVMGSTSHLTCNFDRVVREGINSYRDRILKRMAEPTTEKQRIFLESLLNVYDALSVWHRRYLNLLSQRHDAAQTDEERAYYRELYENLCGVPFNPPKNYKQALQSVWFTFAFLRLCGNWPGIGRLDHIVGPYLENDLNRGDITENEAREYMAHFFIKGCEWITLRDRGSGDAQHYQNLVIGGCDIGGNEISGTATRLILEVVEEFPISDFPIAARLTEDSPPWLIEKLAAVIKHGGGVAAVYNENLIIDSLVEFGYTLEEARQFANDGCWEVQVPGKTCFSYAPMDIYAQFQRELLGLYDDRYADYPDFESMFAEFACMTARLMENWHKGADRFRNPDAVTSVVAFFEDDCIENARDYHDCGTRYSVLSPHLGGVPDTANAMYAIKKLVFDEKKLTFPEFMDILRDNWEGNEALRQYVRKSYKYYGNDNDEVDGIVVRIMDCFMDETRRIKSREGILRPPGISTFGRQIEWRNTRKASPHGFRGGDILASNLSPTPNTDFDGATTVIRSHCKINLSKLTCGTALDIKLDPTSVSGPDGAAAISALLTGFIKLGGFFMQIDILDNAVLLEAQKHPEDYQNLSVRIAGWSARFVTLDEHWQQMIIERTTLQGGN
ncbi:MAG: pyruvate formate lyase family protein [Eubacteriales bacterium]|jgi:pyruvate-formate lyase|nr:pyruvate formate lyase family protein [Eubacteriales bacterium]